MYSTIKNKLKASITYILFPACTAVFICLCFTARRAGTGQSWLWLAGANYAG